MIRTQVGEAKEQVASVRARAGRGQTLRRRAREAQEKEQGWSTLAVPFTDPDAFADEVSGYGPDVLVDSPPEVRDLVLARLRGAAAQESPTGGAR
jgi:proteasome accessory factor B